MSATPRRCSRQTDRCHPAADVRRYDDGVDDDEGVDGALRFELRLGFRWLRINRSEPVLGQLRERGPCSVFVAQRRRPEVVRWAAVPPVASAVNICDGFAFLLSGSSSRCRRRRRRLAIFSLVQHAAAAIAYPNDLRGRRILGAHGATRSDHV